MQEPRRGTSLELAPRFRQMNDGSSSRIRKNAGWLLATRILANAATNAPLT